MKKDKRVATGLLPKNVVPRNYRINLCPHLDRFIFNGEEVIDVEILASTASITLNAADLNVGTAAFTPKEGPHYALNINVDKKRQTIDLTLQSGNVFPVGPAQIYLSFHGLLNDQMAGFYRSKYILPDGRERYMATTQFEAIDARRAFPCFDEPAFKATFELSLRIPKELQAISNMPIIEEWDANPQKDVWFAKTPLMSTYLLAIMVGDFELISAAGPNGVSINVWTTPGKKEQGRFALEAAVKILEFYNDYFGIPYPLPKLDLIAIPDFAAGAMENWGAITFREEVLLVDPQKSSQATKERVAIVVAHEIAHMWFGNLVTMAWWDDLWLNEGFASFMEYKAVDHIFPEWNLWTRFVGGDFAMALASDGLRNSHPIETRIEDPNLIGEQFDAISYSKGACVIRMLEDFLGEEVFRKGLRKYVNKYKYRNARTQDLWKCLEKVSGKPVAKIMDTWTKQAGYPVLRVDNGSVDCVKTVQLSQERFLYEGKDPKDKTKWQIPVVIRLPKDFKTVSAIMSKSSKTIYLPQSAEEKRKKSWIKVNPGHKGFYRTCYDLRGWAGLIYAIRDGEGLHSSDRAGLMNDAYAFLRAGYVDAPLFFMLTEAYQAHEDDYTVWNQIGAAMAGLDYLLAGEDFHNEFQKFGKWLFGPILEKLGWRESKADNYQDILLRSLALDMMILFDDETVLAKARFRFEKYLSNDNSLNSNIKGLVFNAAAKQGNVEIYETFVRLYRNAKSSEEKNRFLSAMAYFKDPILLSRALDFSLSSDVRSQDVIRVIGGISKNYFGRDLCWNFFKDNFDELMKRYGSGGGFMLSGLVESTAGGFTIMEKAAEVEEFFATHPVLQASRSIQQAIETIKLRAEWISNNRDEVAKCLAEWSAGKT